VASIPISLAACLWVHDIEPTEWDDSVGRICGISYAKRSASRAVVSAEKLDASAIRVIGGASRCAEGAAWFGRAAKAWIGPLVGRSLLPVAGSLLRPYINGIGQTDCGVTRRGPRSRRDGPTCAWAGGARAARCRRPAHRRRRRRCRAARCGPCRPAAAKRRRASRQSGVPARP
jgi:hypothetical protein